MKEIGKFFIKLSVVLLIACIVFGCIAFDEYNHNHYGFTGFAISAVIAAITSIISMLGGSILTVLVSIMTTNEEVVQYIKSLNITNNDIKDVKQEEKDNLYVNASDEKEKQFNDVKQEEKDKLFEKTPDEKERQIEKNENEKIKTEGIDEKKEQITKNDSKIKNATINGKFRCARCGAVLDKNHDPHFCWQCGKEVTYN